jgi:hypothetical protein
MKLATLKLAVKISVDRCDQQQVNVLKSRPHCDIPAAATGASLVTYFHLDVTTHLR